MAPLVEAHRDGRLGEREAASLERHLTTCASCRSLSLLLGRMADHLRAPPAPDPDPLTHQRARLRLLRAATFAAPGARPGGAGRALVAATAAAAGIAAVVALTTSAMPARAPVPRVSRFEVRVPALPSARMDTQVRASAGARYQRHPDGGSERIDLGEGALDIEVRPLRADERFVVATDDAEVEVRGTEFRVEATGGRLVGVSVSRGKVEVRYRGLRELIPAGGAFHPDDHDTSPPARPPAAVAGSALARSRPAQAAPPASAEPAPGVRGAPGVPGDGRAPGPDFAAGLALIERGDDAAGAEKLEAFRAANPSDPRAEDAAFLAILAQQRAHHPAAAAEAAQRFLTLFPHSPRRGAVEAIRQSP
jgi:ferric-dicitrate binding protein FerR (iron transport regulator)